MKIIIVTLGLLIAVGTMAQPLPQENIKIAASGCCKEYDNRRGRWRIINRDFGRCKDLNRRYDNGDDIYRKSGDFWWDSRCR